MDKIRVAIADDDLNWIKEMVKLLGREEDISIVGTASNKEEAFKLFDSIQADIILLDVNLTGNKHDGIDIAFELYGKAKSKIIMLSAINLEDVICNSFIAGAVNYISKTNYRELPTVIRDTYKGVSPVEALAKDYTRLRKEEQLKDLTETEKEIFRLAEEGYSRTQMVEKLCKSENTLKNQVRGIIKKLGVSSMKEAVRKVRMRGILNRGD